MQYFSTKVFIPLTKRHVVLFLMSENNEGKYWLYTTNNILNLQIIRLKLIKERKLTMNF